MANLERKIKRNKNKKKVKELNKTIARKVGQFNDLPDCCLACKRPFDKKSKEHATTWNVVVREDKETVRLYCPDCWDKAKEILADFTKRLEDRVETGT